ncbi:LysR family transcriptional regulator [Crossiella sp. CA-258035]|uniref:LysR family transcriptional regulator n=1 Tax=Crossiella sp. CA-258035 TaxID=2981138 RepID=UPI0024BC01A2|nr:LysR family transcriptional regulator [Crossiella sp. CA-258035]WHT16768.1 LysR family transcriptional regulator [Crossiella sp. CA-258035]
MVELRHLRYFLAVAEDSSFTRAARRLRVSQPTLSQQIRALERTVGGPLFDRLPSGARLTPAEQALLEPARRAITTVREGLQTAGEVVRSAAGKLRVGLIYGGAGAVTQPILSAFGKAFPHIQLDGPLASSRSAQLFGRAEVLLPGSAEFEAGMAVYLWQSDAAERGRSVTETPRNPLLRIGIDRVVYTEHWLRREGFAPRQRWVRAG